jgi:hypothetical protein
MHLIACQAHMTSRQGFSVTRALSAERPRQARSISVTRALSAERPRQARSILMTRALSAERPRHIKSFSVTRALSETITQQITSPAKSSHLLQNLMQENRGTVSFTMTRTRRKLASRPASLPGPKREALHERVPGRAEEGREKPGGLWGLVFKQANRASPKDPVFPLLKKQSFGSSLKHFVGPFF